MITSSQQQAPLGGGSPFSRNGIPSAMHHNTTPSTGAPVNNPATGNAELTGDSLWDALYNTTIRTLSLDGLELLAKSFDNLDPNHQLYAGIAKRQRKLMEYQSEFRRNLEVFCQRANLSTKQWPSCIRHVKPSPHKESSANNSANTSAIDGLLNWTATKKQPEETTTATVATPGESNVAPSTTTPMTPLPQPQQQSPKASPSKPEETTPVEEKKEEMPQENKEGETKPEQPSENNNNNTENDSQNKESESCDEKTPEWA